MPKLIRQGKSENVKEGGKIKEAAENLGIPFSCSSGICGMCAIDVIKGEENLSEMTENEEDLGMGGGMRLACQCKIKSGDVEIK